MKRVTHALILRDIKAKFGEQRLGYLWALLEPILFVTILAGLYSMRSGRDIDGMPLTTFLVTGFVPFFLFRNIMTACLHIHKSESMILFRPGLYSNFPPGLLTSLSFYSVYT